MKRIGILTSGGDASGMDPCSGSGDLVRKGLSMGMEVYAIDRGFEGLLDGNIEKMQWHSVGDILQRGGTILLQQERTGFLFLWPPFVSDYVLLRLKGYTNPGQAAPSFIKQEFESVL